MSQTPKLTVDFFLPWWKNLAWYGISSLLICQGLIFFQSSCSAILQSKMALDSWNGEKDRALSCKGKAQMFCTSCLCSHTLTRT